MAFLPAYLAGNEIAKESIVRLIACMLMISIGLIGNSAAAQNKEMKMVDPSEFVIMPWGTTSGDQSVFDTIRDCGFNTAGFVRVDDLDKVEKAGLKCLVSDPTTHAGDKEAQLDQTEIDKRVQALVKRVAGHKAAFGYYLRDEPTARVFPGLGRWAAAVYKADPNALAYINLFPMGVSIEALGVYSYDHYLDEFVQQIKPKFISYDRYSLMDDGSLAGGYFLNLERVRAASHRHNLPFWNIVLSNSHFRYAEPTPAGFRFQLFTTLAYGARGISYFTYFTPKIGNYRLGPIDQFGNKTQTWYMLRDVNLQLQNILPVYITLKNVNVFHHPNVPDGSQGIATSKFIESVEGGGDFVVGEFEGPDGQQFAMVVNRDLHKSTPFQVKFKEDGEIQRVSAYTGQINPWQGEDRWLAAGQGMLLCLKK